MKLTKTIRPAFKVEVPNLKWALKYLAQKSEGLIPKRKDNST